MGFCPHCGSKIEDEKEGCKSCGYMLPSEGNSENGGGRVDLAKDSKAPIVGNISDNQNNQGPSNQGLNMGANQANNGTNNQQNQNNKGNGEDLSSLVKVILTLASIFLPFVGIIAGILFMNSNNSENAAFGKKLLTIACVVIVIGAICCCLYFGLIGVGIGMVGVPY